MAITSSGLGVEMLCSESRTSPLACTGLLLALSAGLAGCSSSLAPVSAVDTAAVTGNWQMSSVAASAAKLPMISGSLTGVNSSVSGTFHSTSPQSCVAPTTAIKVTGSADAKDLLTLTGPLAGGTLTIEGTLASDGKSLEAATYNVAGGSCAFPAAAAATAQSYSSITGSYTGSFSDSSGLAIAVDASLTQTPASDTSGNFQLSGTGTFPNNPCFSSPVTVSNAQVTGGSFTLTYADPTTMNSVTASGTFSTDAKTLTVTNWTLTGFCGPDSGTGSLTRP